MPFPLAVMSVQKSLLEDGDVRSGTMQLLTQARDDDCLYVEDLEKMWNGLLELNGGFGDAVEQAWVYAFLNTVHRLRELPEYFYLSEERRRDVVKRIKEHTKELEKIFQAYDLNDQINSEISFVDALQLMARLTIKNVEHSSVIGKTGKNVKVVTFVRLLAQHHQMMFGDALNSVIKTASLAIYNHPYSDSDISNLLNR